MARIEYITCPMCGLNRVLKSKSRLAKGKPEIATFDHGLDIENLLILQIREGGGKVSGPRSRTGRGSARGSGFYRVGGSTLREMLNDPEYQEVLEDLKTKFLRLQEAFRRIGFI